MKLWLITLVAFMFFHLSLSKAEAQTKDFLPEELENYPALELRLMDDPDALFKQIKRHFRELGPDTTPVRWIRAIWVATKKDAIAELVGPADFNKARDEAFRLGMHIEWVDFKTYEIEAKTYEEDAFALEKIEFENMIRELRTIKNTYALASGLANFTEFLLRNDKLEQALPIIDEANNLIKEVNQVPLPVYDMVKYAFALSLRYQGQIPASVAIQMEVDKRYVSLKLRSARAHSLYDLCLTMADQKIDLLQKDLPALEGYSAEAIRLGMEINDEFLVAKHLYAFSSLKSKTEKHEESVVLAKKALDLFEKEGATLWVARGLRLYAKTLIRTERYQQSLEVLDRVEKLESPSNRYAHSEIEDYRYQALKRLGRPDKALTALEKYFALYRATSKEREDQVFNQAAVKLGLQYEAERNTNLVRENNLQSEQILLLEKFKLVSLLAAGLSLVILAVLFIVWRQASVIRLSRQHMKDVLDSIDEGIVTLDRHLTVQDSYSPYLDQIFGTAPSTLGGVTLLDLLFAPGTAAEAQGILAKESLLTCMGEQKLTWELNSGHLPHEILFHDQTLQLHWQPLFTTQNTISRLLLSIRDITAQRDLEKKMEQETQRISKTQKKLEEILGGKNAAIRTLFKELKNEWPALQGHILLRDEHAEVMRRLHTWKGSARTLGLKLLASDIHEMESCLLSAPDSQKSIADQWDSLTAVFHDYLHLLDTILVSGKTEETVDSDLYAMAALYAREIKQRLAQAGCPRQGFIVLDDVQDWKAEVLPRIHEMLLHAVANAVDHGFIRPSQDKQRVAAALIQIRAFASNHEVELSVLDNGVGINWNRLRAMAETLNFQPKSGEFLTDLLFMDGVSTAESISHTSGRGVGLSAIRSLCLELGGQIRLEDGEGGGAALRMNFPRASLVKSAPEDHQNYPPAA